jgi:hypothetical protein
MATLFLAIEIQRERKFAASWQLAAGGGTLSAPSLCSMMKQLATKLSIG